MAAGLIQRSPTGLLDLLALKSSGDNPQVFPETLQGIIDCTQLYLANRWEYRTDTLATPTVNAVGQFGFSIATSMVPAQELWIVDGAVLTTTAALAAGTTYTFRLGVHETVVPTPQRVSDAVTATTGAKPNCSLNDQFIMRPNDRFAVFAEAVTIGTVPTFSLSFRLVRLII